MNRRGSALVETSFAALLAAALAAGALTLGRLSLSGRRAGALARHAAALTAAGVPAGVVDDEISSYASHWPEASFVWGALPFDRLPAARFYRLVEARVAVDVPVAGVPRRLTRFAVLEAERP